MRVLKRADAMASLLTGKNAVVTGANRGIGAAILAEFAAQGANVWACARREEPCFLEMCARLTQEHGVWIEPVIFDLADEDGIKAGVQQIRIGKKPVDILVNNAGVIPENRLFLMADPAEMQRVFAVNFFAAMQLTQRVAKLMVRQKAGAIVNICSIAALDGEPAQMEYVASKAALVGATRKLASELGAYGIRVNGIAPGPTQTDMLAAMEEGLRSRMEAATLLHRLAEPQEIASVAVFLASDMASYMTGQILRVDGGMRR